MLIVQGMGWLMVFVCFVLAVQQINCWHADGWMQTSSLPVKAVIYPVWIVGLMADWIFSRIIMAVIFWDVSMEETTHMRMYRYTHFNNSWRRHVARVIYRVLFPIVR